MSELAIVPLPYPENPCVYFDRLKGLPAPVFLDSAPGTERRYSLLSAAPDALLSLEDDCLYLERSGIRTELPCTELGQWQQRLLDELDGVEAQGQPFVGGLIGFWGYELAKHLEPGRFTRRSGLPDLLLGRYLWALIIDHQEQRASLVAHPSLAPATFDALQQRLLQPACAPAAEFALCAPFTADTEKARYLDAFARIQAYIRAGDCYQVNLTQRFSTRYTGDLWQGYQRLRSLSPVPYGAYLAFDQLSIASLSPEQFLRVDEGAVSTKPIKGTRPRSQNVAEDLLLARELAQSPKDRAENLMIVDLLRNDLGRSCTPGSVRVPKLFALESFANVHHLVSTVTGTLRDDQSPGDLLLAAFPGGSITGAPKIRAMEIIEELEEHARSVYCGSIGYISRHGRMDTSIAIRTLVGDGEYLYCWGGGGIVADSEAESEYAESLHKVQNLLAGLA